MLYESQRDIMKLNKKNGWVVIISTIINFNKIFVNFIVKQKYT